MHRAALASLCVVMLVGCGMRPARGPDDGPTSARSPYALSPEAQDQVRHMSDESDRQQDAAESDRLDELEKEALTAVRVTLGKQPVSESQPMPLPASQGIVALRKQSVKMRIEPVVNWLGGQSDDFLQLKDAPTDRLSMLARKSSEGTASADERREMMAYQKIVFKLLDLRMQVMKASLAAVEANSNVQTSSLTTMMRVASIVRLRKMYEMELSKSDLDTVRRGIERQRRAEAIAATTMAMLAAYQAVINNGADPRGIDIIAEGTLKAFPMKPVVSDAEVKAYVGNLFENVQKVKARYETGLRKTWGDAKYESRFKASTDQMFAAFESASSQKSIAEMADDGPRPSSPRRRASAVTPTAPPPVPRSAKTTTGGDAGATLDAAAKLFPGDTTIGASLQGISALKNGDPKGAINAALTFVPVPGLKDVFGVASKVLFKD